MIKPTFKPLEWTENPPPDVSLYANISGTLNCFAVIVKYASWSHWHVGFSMDTQNPTPFKHKDDAVDYVEAKYKEFCASLLITPDYILESEKEINKEDIKKGAILFDKFRQLHCKVKKRFKLTFTLDYFNGETEKIRFRDNVLKRFCAGGKEYLLNQTELAMEGGHS